MGESTEMNRDVGKSMPEKQITDQKRIYPAAIWQDCQ
jgi:hypothetical protein